MPIVEQIGTGRPVVFVHGSPGNRRTWSRVLPYRPTGYSAWVMELAGHGTQPIGDGGLQTYVDDLASVVSGAGTPVTLVGLSVGGYLVLRVLTTLAPFVERVVACAAPATFSQAGVEFRTALAADVRAGRHTGATLYASLVDAMVAPSERDEDIERILKEPLLDEEAERLVRFIERAAEIGLPESHITPYGTPTTLIVGQEDAFLPLADAEVTRALGERAEMLVLPTSSHMLPLSHPQIIARHAFGGTATS